MTLLLLEVSVVALIVLFDAFWVCLLVDALRRHIRHNPELFTSRIFTSIFTSRIKVRSRHKEQCK